MANPKFKPAAWAKQEDLEKFSFQVDEALQDFQATLADLDRHQEVLEIAIISIARDLEQLSDVLVQAGLLEAEDVEQSMNADDLAEVPYDPAAATMGTGGADIDPEDAAAMREAAALRAKAGTVAPNPVAVEQEKLRRQEAESEAHMRAVAEASRQPMAPIPDVMHAHGSGGRTEREEQ